MPTKIRKQAEELANRSYSVLAFRDKTTDGDYVYMAVTPELEGCMAQGETMRAAQENLRLFRIDFVQHLLENNLPVPAPAWMATTTTAESIVLPAISPVLSFEDALDKAIQPNNREKLFEAQLRVEYDLVEQGYKHQ